MHKLFTFLSLPLLLFGLAAAHKPSDREDEQLLGPVRSVNSQTTMSLEGEPKTSKGLTRQLDLVAYDDRGNEAERTIYDDYGFLRGRHVNKRDPDGHLVEGIMSDPKGAVLGREVYVYSGGKLAETVSYDGKGEVGLREVRAYDERGQLSEVTYYEGTKAFGKTVYRYDGEGRGSEMVFYLADGSKAVAPIGPCLGAHRMTYSYDEKGRSQKVVAYETNGKMKKSWFYAYNDRGLMAEEKVESDGSYATSVYAYEYDKRGNWTRRTETETTLHKPGQFRILRDLGYDEPDEMPPSRARIIYSRKIAYYEGG